MSSEKWRPFCPGPNVLINTMTDKIHENGDYIQITSSVSKSQCNIEAGARTWKINVESKKCSSHTCGQ